MSEMSPLARILMRVLRSGAYASAILLVLFAGILVWQRMSPDGSIALSRQDFGFLAVLACMIVLAIYLVRAISREITNPKS